MTTEQKNLKYKFIAYVYYPLQYLIVRFALFGFILQPDLIDMYNGFNISGIVKVVTDFIFALPDVVDVEYYGFIIFNIIPYLIRLIYELRNIIVFVFALIQLIEFIRYTIKINEYKADSETRVLCNIGAPGSGKSSRAGYDAVLLAQKMWQRLQDEYRLYKPYVSEWIKTNNTSKLKQWREIEKAYIYNSNNAVIPCLWSNIPIMVRGEYSSPLTIQHLKQGKYIPYLSVIYIDEVGALLPVEMSNDKILTISDFFRLCRHFGDWRIICTEQCPDNVYIDTRRVVGLNVYMLSQKWSNKPLVLLGLFNLLKFIWRKKFPDGNKKFSDVLIVLDNVISHIGARKYQYCKEKNVTMVDVPQITKEFKKVKTMYLPPRLNYQYDDRTYKELYKAKNGAYNTEFYTDLILQDTITNRERCLRAK